MLFNVRAMVAAFAAGLIRMRAREGKRIAKANGRLGGKQQSCVVVGVPAG